MSYKADVESYGGEFDGDLMQVVRRFPAFWVTYSGSGKSTPVGTSKDKWLKPVTFVVMAGAYNTRGEADRRRGVTVNGVVVEAGVYQMLNDARDLLIRQDFGLAISPLTPGAERTLFNTVMTDRGISVFAQEWHTQFVVNTPTEAAVDLLRIGMTYTGVPGNKPVVSDLLTTR
ncbi:MAG: phage protein Gp37 [Pseudomonadota bacterium]